MQEPRRQERAVGQILLLVVCLGGLAAWLGWMTSGARDDRVSAALQEPSALPMFPASSSQGFPRLTLKENR